MIIKWYGTASIGIESGGQKILFDPFIPLKGSNVDTCLEDYEPYDTIFITHGHLDHIGSMKDIANKQYIFSTLTPAVSMLDDGVDRKLIREVHPGSIADSGIFKVLVFPGKHIEFDKALIAKTILNSSMVRHAANLKKLAEDNRSFRENGETVSYLIEAEGKKIFLMGSLGLQDDAAYPENMDLLILPYQGSSNLLPQALKTIKRLKPRAVLLDHFDNTFPPISQDVDTSDIQEALEGIIPVTVPVHKQKYTL